MSLKDSHTLFAILLISTALSLSQDNKVGHASDAFFGLDKVWEIHLQMEPEEWATIQPPEDMDWDFLKAFQKVGEDAIAGKNFHSERSTRPGLAGYFGVDHQYGKGNITIGEKTINDVGIRFKGNGTFVEGLQKKKLSFKIDFNEFVEDQEHLGLTKINLNNCITDPSMMREALSYEVFRGAGIKCSRVSWAKVSLTVPGEFKNKYIGLYSILEQVDKRFLKHRYGTKKGLLLKPSTFGIFRYFEEDWEKYEKDYVPKTEATPEQQKHLMDFARLVQISGDSAFEEEIESYLDVDQFLRFLAVNVLLSNLDSFLGGSQNYYVYLNPETNRFQLLPWDMDHSFGAFILVGTLETRQQLSIDHPQLDKNLLIERVLAMPRFKQSYHDYLNQYTDTLFNKEKMFRVIDKTGEFLRPLVALEGEKALRRFEATLAEKQQERKPHSLKHFVVKRPESIHAQLSGQSQGEILKWGEMPPGTIKQWIGIAVAIGIALLLNFAAYIRGIIVGFRGSVGWGCLNLFLYPITPLYYGYKVRADLGRKSARMVLWCIGILILVILVSIWTLS